MLKSTKELLEYVIEASVLRIKKPLSKLFISSLMGGMFIAFGAIGNLLVSSDLIKVNPGMAKFLGAAVFPVGLMGIVILGYDLFTSNCLMLIGYIEKKYKFMQMLKILIIVWIFNFIGALIIVFISYKTHTLSDSSVELLASVAKYKVSSSAINIFLKAILCNVLVAGASLMGYISKDGISKIFGIWFPIMLFIILGYDHVVANMLYLPLAYLLKVDGVTLMGILYNFTFATLGNFIGGGVVIGLSLLKLNK